MIGGCKAYIFDTIKVTYNGWLSLYLCPENPVNMGLCGLNAFCIETTQHSAASPK